MKNIKEFILESNGSVKHDDLGNRGMFYSSNGELSYYEDCYVYPVETEDCIEVTMLRVDVKKQGTGSDLVKALIKFAEEKNKCILVYAQPLTDAISEDNLIKFYMGLGFIQDDRSKDKHCLIYKTK